MVASAPADVKRTCCVLLDRSLVKIRELWASIIDVGYLVLLLLGAAEMSVPSAK